ncbi:hypothetical protein QR680_008478 [Steinernema hermaphroditum]|uniref:Uncharacterized protein n=1 Tax=Steinernema hermaphroditum TaxID=289476 RepID=A0AA39II84_9BILA|nr:hypothetical protein QR680_008478 [Steinernema hermaphroditum]
MPSAKEAPMPTPSVFCGCCRSPKKFEDKAERTPPDVTQEPIQTTITASSTRPPVTVTPIPQIVVTSPPSFRSSPKKLSDFCDEKSPRDVFATARSSTDTTEYQSMAELVRGIRREAGVPETPRVVDEDKAAVQLNVENLTRVIEPDPSPSTSSAPPAASPNNTSLAVTIENHPEVPLTVSRHRSLRSVLSEMPQLIVYYVGFVYLWCISSMYQFLHRLL